MPYFKCLILLCPGVDGDGLRPVVHDPQRRVHVLPAARVGRDRLESAAPGGRRQALGKVAETSQGYPTN